VIETDKALVIFDTSNNENETSFKKVLKKLGVKSTLYLGVKKGEKEKMIAHAWLIAGEEKITGEQGYEKFTVVGCYA